ncbi:MAG: LAGLIDADG family homing endonuclease [Candidatus Diapherotrites archaeon]|nr:LAGLIDADG family homing endonuclease [Candidatus Diapherotrites archaeon]
MQGLFDSDGTITKRSIVKYASTSSKICSEIQYILSSWGIKSTTSEWIKNKKYLPLYSVSLQSKNSVLKFAQNISFRHPVKNKKLAASLELLAP